MSTIADHSTESAKLTIEIPKNLHAYIKSQSALQHTSVKDFVVSAIMNSLDITDYNCESEHFHNYSQNTKLLSELKQSAKDHKDYKAGKNNKFKSFDNIKDLIADLNSDEDDKG